MDWRDLRSSPFSERYSLRFGLSVKSSESIFELILNEVAQIFNGEDVELAQKFCHFSQVRREGWKRKRFDKKVPRASKGRWMMAESGSGAAEKKQTFSRRVTDRPTDLA